MSENAAIELETIEKGHVTLHSKNNCSVEHDIVELETSSGMNGYGAHPEMFLFLSFSLMEKIITVSVCSKRFSNEHLSKSSQAGSLEDKPEQAVPREHTYTSPISGMGSTFLQPNKNFLFLDESSISFHSEKSL